MTAALVLGAFNLVQAAASTAAPWLSKVLTDGTNRGNPVPIQVQVQSWLQDGAIVVTQGYDNREVAVKVKLTADTLLGVGAAEAALFAEIGKPNTLSWTPNVALVAPIVFVVITSKLDHLSESGWDDAEVAGDPSAKYQLSLTCEAFPRSTTQFTSVGIAPGGATTTTLDTCGATTGWTATVDGVPGTVVNAVGPPTTNAVNGPPVSVGGNHTVTLQKTFAATTSTTNLLMVDWIGTVGTVLTAIGDGVTLPRFAQSASPTSGYTRTWFKVAASSLAVTKFSALAPMILGASQGLRIDNVAVTNVVPTSGTNRQILRSLDVPGSAPTPASLAVESSTAALGDGTLVYVFPADATSNGYLPSLRQFRVSGNAVTPNAALVSGSSEPVNGVTVLFQIPVSLMPSGTYVIVGRLATSGGGTPTIGWSGSTNLNGASIGVTPTFTRVITTTTTYQNFVLGRMQFPTMDLDQAAWTAGATVELAVLCPSGTCTYDEFWLFNTTIGYLTAVHCGTGAGTVGGSSRRLYLDPPSTVTPRPTVRVGHNADRSDSHYPKLGGGAQELVVGWQAPRFVPPLANVLVVTPNATDAVVTLSGYARSHTIAGS